jgi:hypothetical protein
MTNAKLEFMTFVEMLPKVVAATIEHNFHKYVLKVGYTKESYEAFLDNLNFTYDDGYGSQELFGTVWFEDGTWGEREEYDGSEWWSYCMCPEIPSDLY